MSVPEAWALCGLEREGFGGGMASAVSSADAVGGETPALQTGQTAACWASISAAQAGQRI
jgi:hypothetical protein